jgi:transposase
MILCPKRRKEIRTMVKRQMYHEIKKLQRLGYGKNKITRELRIDKKTVIKYWEMDEEEYRQYLDKSRYRDKEYDSLREEILDLYLKNENIKIPVSAVYDYLEEMRGKLPANENSLRNYIRYMEETGELVISTRRRYYSMVPEMPYGKQLQIDFGQKKNHRGGTYYIFAAVLSASRFKYAALQERPFTAQDLIEHLLNCFDYMQGMPEELVIDQDCTMVVDENAGDIIYTKDFDAFIGEMGIKMRVCRKADPESKGKIENFIKYIKYNFFAIRKFEYLKEASESLIKWLERRANGKISQTTKKIPGIEIEEERKHLKPVRQSIYRKQTAGEREERAVSDKCRITVDTSQYDLPDKYRNQTVEIFKTGEKLFVFDRHSGTEIADYQLSLIPGQIVKNRAVSREMGVKLKALKQEVAGYFTLENWGSFLDINFMTFARYTRDQCIEARKYFYNQEIDLEMFGRAITYCLENKTYSMSNLNDSYNHFTYEKKERMKEGFTGSILMIKKGSAGIIPEIKVTKPDLAPYRSLINAAGGER